MAQGLNTQVLQLNTESMDRDTANTSKIGGGGSHHKRVMSNPNSSYVKIQNNTEMQSTNGTSDAVKFNGVTGVLPSTSTNNFTSTR